MAKASRSDVPSLADLRREIDRIDAAMHGLLMERGEIIDRLIAVKQTQETGSAFRPAREADTWSVRVAGWGARAPAALAPSAEVIAVPDRTFDGAALLISVPVGGSINAVADTLVAAGASVRSTTLVGSHATRYRVAAGAAPVTAGRYNKIVI